MSIIKNIDQELIDERELYVTLNEMESTLIKDILGKITDLSHTDANVIITGEAGSGKHWITKLMHVLDADPQSRFYQLPCEQLKSTDIDLFPEHLKNELDQVYTENFKCDILIDNFSELSSDVQIQLLRSILQVQSASESAFPGKENSIRFIFTMSGHWYKSNTKEYVWTYLFDLLNPISVVIPPLREHREDIIPLANLFLKQQKERQLREFGSVRELEISHEALFKCISYDWPGNIRQLKNAITHAYFSTKTDVIEPEDLPISIDSTPIYYSSITGKSKCWSYIKAERKLLEQNSLLQESNMSYMSITAMLKKIISKNR